LEVVFPSANPEDILCSGSGFCPSERANELAAYNANAAIQGINIVGRII
jgi:hypothetical protein